MSRTGQRVFIAGCLGGVGRIAIQIAGIRGAEVTGSCSASRRNEALSLGIQEAVDYRNFDTNTYRGYFDVVFDTHGALSLSQCGTLLKRGGVALHIVPTPLKMLRSLLSPRHQAVMGGITAQFAEAVEQGKITPTIGRIVPLSEAISAIIELEKTSSPPGKLVVIPV